MQWITANRQRLKPSLSHCAFGAILLFSLYSPLVWAQTQISGQAWQRAFGTVIVAAQVDPNQAIVTVTITIDKQLVDQPQLSAAIPSYLINVANGNTNVTGNITLIAKATPTLAALKADLNIATSGQAVQSFRGTLGTWLWPKNLIYAEHSFALSSELSARTTIQGKAQNIATITLYAGSQPLGLFTLTQGSPMAIIANDLVLGDAKVWANTEFILTVPTLLQPGSVLMRGQFASGSIPKTSLASTIAIWSLNEKAIFGSGASDPGKDRETMFSCPDKEMPTEGHFRSDTSDPGKDRHFLMALSHTL